MSWISTSTLAGLAAASTMILIGPSSAFASLPSGERAHGDVSIEPAYDDMTGNIVYLQTPNKHAPLNPDNPTSHRHHVSLRRGRPRLLQRGDAGRIGGPNSDRGWSVITWLAGRSISSAGICIGQTHL
jgi:hypothetical protein